MSTIRLGSWRNWCGSGGAHYILSVPDPLCERLAKRIAPVEAFQKPNHIRIFEREQFADLVRGAGLVIERQVEAGRHILFVGHKGHPEVIGTMGQVPEGSISLVETVADVAKLSFPADAPLAFLTQTALSVDDTAEIVAALRAKFPQIAGPKAEDICYATSNRQEAVKAIAGECDLLLVIGAPNSSNSLRLVEVALRGGAKAARLIDDVSQLDLAWLDGVATLGLTAGASAPEELVQDLIATLSVRYDITLSDVAPVRETVTFKLPRALSAQPA